LAALLSRLPSGSCTTLDSRLEYDFPPTHSINVRRVSPTILSRFMAEYWLFRNAKSGDTILCFGNLPPLFNLKCRVVVFIQNRYTIQKVTLHGFSFGQKIRILVERFWFLSRMANASDFIVQTPTMKSYLSFLTGFKTSINVRPFKGGQLDYRRSIALQDNAIPVCDFIYVASAEPHKNHINLIKAWCLLAEEGIFPSLILTLDQCFFDGLLQVNLLNECKSQVKISNVGKLSNLDTLDLLSRSRALIYPSKFEAFGLPLIEARQAGLPVLASELDYVRDILDPEESFDPDSPVSIAKAVKRFLGLKEGPLTLLSPEDFLSSLMGGER